MLLLVLLVKNKLHAINRAVSTRKPRSLPLFSSNLMLPCGRELVTGMSWYIPRHVCMFLCSFFGHFPLLRGQSSKGHKALVGSSKATNTCHQRPVEQIWQTFILRSNNIFTYRLRKTYPTNTLIITLERERIMHEYRLRVWDRNSILW